MTSFIKPINIFSEFKKRINSNECATWCGHCGNQMVCPGGGYEITLYADFGVWKHKIGNGIIVCDSCAERVRNHKDMDFDSINPKDFE